jgi:indole-3-glycerol phosphate synthase
MNCLDHLVATTRRRVSCAKQISSLAELEERARLHSPRGFCSSLCATAQNSPALIAELKRASPSRGVIRDEFVASALANQMCRAGATALSVLTVESFFLGSLQDLRSASAASDVPCLRKDFIVDEFQIIEARAYGADAVLLILAALSDSEFRSLLAMARALELDALCEVHDERELDRALAEDVEMIGVNSRDLSDFSVNSNTFKLIARVPESVLAVAESGIGSGQEIRSLQCQGYRAFLIGQILMEAENPGNKLQQLLAETECAPAAFVRHMKRGA